MAGDGRIVIDVILDDGSVARGVADLGNRVDGLGSSGERASLGIGKIVAALGLAKLASVGIDMVKQSLDGAIKRYDTLNTFPRVLEMMGFDAQQSKGAIDKLAEGIQGLPTRLDEVAKTAQNMAVMTGDLDGAVETTLALNNAFLSSGSSSADASRGLDQYVQMLSKGEVDLTSWRTLQETMGPALNKTAEAFGFAGASAQNDLYAALKDGDVTFDQFNAKLVELDGAVGGFAEMAAVGSAGIGTSWANMKTAVVNGVTGVIAAVDDALVSFGGIEGILETMKEATKSTFKAIAEAIPAVIEKVKEVYNTLEPWMPLLKAATLAIGTFVVAIATINSVIGIFALLKKAIIAVNSALFANPIVLIVAAIITAAVLIYVYWEPIKAFFIELWAAIKESALAIWEVLKEAWASSVEWLKSTWSSITTYFSELWNSVKEVFTSAWEGIKESWNDSVADLKETWASVTEFFTGIWDVIVATATSIWDTVVAKWNSVVSFVTTIFAPMIEFFSNTWTTILETATSIWDNLTNFLSVLWTNIQIIASSAWEIIKNVILGPILLLINLVTGDMEEFKSNLSAIWTNISEAAGRIWEALKEIVITYITMLIDNSVAIFTGYVSILAGYWTAIQETAANIWNAIVDFIVSKIEFLSTKIESVMQSIKQVIDTAWNFIENLWLTIIEKIVTATGVDFDKMRDSVMMAMDAVKQTIDTIWNFIRVTFQNALVFLKALVKGDFEGIKNAVKNQMNLIKETISFIWSDIKEVFNRTLEAIKTYISTKFENMRSTAKQKTTQTKSDISSAWESIKTYFSTVLTNIVNTVKTKFTEFVNGVKTKMTDAKNRIVDGWNAAQKFLAEIDLAKIGKDVIQGLINGIKSKVEAVGNAVRDVADAITGKIKSILNIQSPSRVMMEIGGFISEGVAIGIDGNKDMVEKSITDLGLLVLDVTDHFKKEEKNIIRKSNAEIASIEKRAKEDIAKINRSAASKKVKTTQDDNVKIQRIQETANKKIATIERKAISDSVKLSDTAQKGMLKEIKLFIEDKKTLGEITIADEAKLWKSSIKMFGEGTKERVEAQKNYNKLQSAAEKERMASIKDHIKEQRAQGEINISDEIKLWNMLYRTAEKGSEQYNIAMKNHQETVKELRAQAEAINKEYNDRMIAIDKEYNAETQKLHDEWNKAYEDKMNQLLNFAGLFDEFKKKTEISGNDLIVNLQSQVTALDEYSKVISSLDKRIDDDSLIHELKSMGVKSLGELQALNSLSDVELTKYANLYREKFRLAKEQTDIEMKPMMDDIDEKLILLKKNTSIKLDELNVEWQAKIKQIVKGTAKEFASMRQVGIDAMQGLSNGMASMSGALQAQAQTIAQSIKDTIASSFDINSPSRWMHNMIGRNMLIGWINGMDSMKTKVVAKSTDATDWMKPNVPDGFTNNLRGVKAPLGRISAFGTSSGGSSSVSNNNSKTFAPNIVNNFTLAESTPSESTRKQHQLLQRLGMEF